MADESQRVTWPPRLVGALFSGSRPFEGPAYLAINNLTVLLGANGAGKSTTLRLLERHLPRIGTTRHDDGWDLAGSACSFFVEVNDDQLETLLRDALERPAPPPDRAKPSVPLVLQPATALEGTPAEPVEIALRHLAPVRSGDRQESAERTEELRHSRLLRVRRADEGTFRIDWCVPSTPGAEKDGNDAAPELGPPVAVAALGSTTRTMLPMAVAVPRDLDEIRWQLREAILDILVHVRWAEKDRWARTHGIALEPTESRRNTRAWLRDPDADIAVVDPDARALCALASDLATTLAPSFVSDVHRAQVSVEPIYEWERGPQLCLELLGPPELRYPMRAAADGHKVWLQLAVLESVAILRRYLAVLEALLERPGHPREGASGDDRLAWKQYDAALGLFRAFSRGKESADPPLDQFISLRNVGHRLYLIDEPEQHLHPRLQRSAARWLVGAGTAGASQCLVVTHSPHYLRIPGNVSFAYLQQVLNGARRTHSTISLLTPELLAATDEVAEEMGFDRGELLSAVSTIVFVEGQADKLFLDAYCGARLHHAGIALVPIHGAVSAERKGVVDSEVVLFWTAAKLAVLLDNLIEDEWRQLEEDSDYRLAQSRKPAKTELKAMADILMRAEQVGRSITPVGIPVDDIFDLLDEEILRERFGFPGHAAARAQHEEVSARKKINWKAFYRETYGVEVEPRLFGEVGEEMARRDASSPQLTRLVDALVLLADNP